LNPLSPHFLQVVISLFPDLLPLVFLPFRRYTSIIKFTTDGG
jgi:hypothetical protein